MTAGGGPPAAGQWFRALPPAPPAVRSRVFCFPHAGGGSAAYGEWPGLLPPDLGVCAATMPGREARIREAPVGDMSVLLGHLLPAIWPQLSVPFAFFGHSMGALVAWELAREIRRAGGPGPRHLFLSACRAPARVAEEYRVPSALPDQELMTLLRDMNGTPAEALRDPELMSMVLPAVRSDFGLLASYTYRPGEEPECPVTVLGGRDDQVVPARELDDWAGYGAGPFEVRLVDGDHFFLSDPAHGSSREVCSLIAARLGHGPGHNGGTA